MPLLLFFLACLAGVACGLSLTAYSVGAGGEAFGTHVGPWGFSARVGAPDIDPYARAHLFTRGELPLAAGEGYTLSAATDDGGAPLDRRCRYRLASPFPGARFWTVTLADPAGQPLANLAGRHGFTSSEILRRQDGSFSIAIGPEAEPGNWLPTGDRGGAFLVLLRLYETPLAATATRLDPRAMPGLERLECPP